MTVKEQIVEKMRACGYDFMTACEEADKTIAEFLASGKEQTTFGIMCGNGKCGDTVTLQRKHKA